MSSVQGIPIVQLVDEMSGQDASQGSPNEDVRLQSRDTDLDSEMLGQVMDQVSRGVEMLNYYDVEETDPLTFDVSACVLWLVRATEFFFEEGSRLRIDGTHYEVTKDFVYRTLVYLYFRTPGGRWIEASISFGLEDPLGRHRCEGEWVNKKHVAGAFLQCPSKQAPLEIARLISPGDATYLPPSDAPLLENERLRMAARNTKKPPEPYLGLWFEDDSGDVSRPGFDPIHLTPNLFALARLIAGNGREITSTDEMVKAVWKGRLRSPDTITSTIRNLNKAMSPLKVKLKNTKGWGYRFET